MVGRADVDVVGSDVVVSVVVVAELEVVCDEVVVRELDVEAFADEPPVKRYGPITSARSCVGTMLLKNGRRGL